MARRGFLDVTVDTLASAVTAAATSITLDDITGFAAHTLAIIEEGTSRAEIVFITAVTTATNTLTVVRGMLDTTAVVHSKGSRIKECGYKSWLSFPIPDIATVYTMCIVPPRGVLVSARTVLAQAIATADAVITLYKAAQAITGGVITIAYSGSATGDIDWCYPTLYNEFNGTTEYLKVINAGACTGSHVQQITLEFICIEQPE